MHGQAVDFAEAAQTLWMDQQREWPLLRQNTDALQAVRTRSIDLGEFAMKVQFNPARIVSTGAKIDAASIGRRPCFLCPANLPPVQRGLGFNEHYTLLANPFPIFPQHFTIPHRAHQPQRIEQALGDMLDLARALRSGYVVFYNGPRCGASAPDHLHFQAGVRDWMPIAGDYPYRRGAPLFENAKMRLYAPRSICPFVSIECADRDAILKIFSILAAELAQIAPAEEEPMVNLIVRGTTEAPAAGWRVILFPRARHRPSFYGDGDGQLLISPGAVDLGGVCITPREKDFDRLTADDLRRVLREVLLDEAAMDRLRDRLRLLRL